jgi:ribosome recycling factor
VLTRQKVTVKIKVSKKMSVSDIVKDAESRMKKSLDSADADFSTLRTGRASAGILDAVKVDYYGVPTPLQQLGTVTVPDARVLMITPWDKGALPLIEKAISNSTLGLTPNSDGICIRLNIPPLTEERRKDLVKQLAGKAESARVSLRNIRRDANDQLKKDEAVTEDDAKRGEKEVQKVLDKYMGELDTMEKAKKDGLMEK